MDCAECEAYEFQQAHPIRSLLLAFLPKPKPSPLAFMAAGFSSTLRAAAGVRQPTHYERHRRAFIETGNDRELERMLRLVR